MSTRTLNDGLVDKVTLYSSSFWLFRRDVLPFVVYYAIFFGLALSTDMSRKYYGLIALPLGLTAHLLLFLLSQWSVNVKCSLGCAQTSDYSKANLLHITAAHNAGKDKLLRLDRVNRNMKSTQVSILGKTYKLFTDSFQFQKVTYNYDATSSSFVRIDYPTQGSIRSYLDWLGHQSMDDVVVSLMKWGKNEFDIPIPNFLDLYLDHLIAPFFVFQVLCLFLWSLDDYWYYSAFTLLMLMFFEGMMCKQRQASLTMLRNMRRPPMHIFAFRGGQWVLITSDLLVPGDVISLTSNENHFQRKDLIRAAAEKKEVQVPCDAILIRGSCVVNEAMLTGESVPQIKETLDNAENKEAGRVDLGPDSTIDATWRRHLVFSGTSLLLHNEVTAAEKGSSPGPLAHQIPSAPDMGAVAVVVRTGFGTCQGGLMRKILFATERVNGSNTMETFYFIGVLVVFAIFAAGSVLVGGLKDENRNKFRLVLHCIMIITSVVPPELPMELSLAVTNSLSALAKSLVYCTEPFRIAYAGKLDVLCFDKTGTLTKDQMILRGVVAAQEVALFSAGSASRGESTSLQPQGNDELLLGSLAADVTEVEVFDASISFDIVSVIMGACHDLMPQPSSLFSGESSDAIVGDPLEQVTMRASGFTFDQFRSVAAAAAIGASSMSNHARDLKVGVRHKYPFSSALKRMSVVVEVDSLSNPGRPAPAPSASSAVDSSSSSVSGRANFVLTKGAPEVLEPLLASVPSFYKATYRFHMSRGKRVLAIACKRLPAKPLTAKDIKDRTRAEAESGLQFVGFLVYDCDMKVDSKSVIRELRSSNLNVVMITGDSVYTAADVARKLGMLHSAAALAAAPSSSSSGAVAASSAADSSCMVLVNCRPAPLAARKDVAPFLKTLVWRRLIDTDADECLPLPEDVKFDLATLADTAKKHSLCLTGPLLATCENQPSVTYVDFLRSVSPHITIFARVSPAQKEGIVQALNGSGLCTLMCGDGTNDVGALKAAHVGISIVNDPEFERRIETARDSSSAPAEKGGKKAKGASAKDRMARAMKEMQEQEQDPTIVKLGDASIASPFTARRTSIDSVLTVIRQGRCTLVTTFQVYKILALNCLVTAYMMSALYMRGLKQGDTQMTASGLIIAGLFFFLSQAKPLQKISPTKPPSSVFAYAVGLSIFGQFLVHLASLVAVLYLCEQHIQEDDFSLSPDGKFQPNVVNSAVYLLSALMQVNNFVVNYRGHPFTQSITENVTLWRSIQVIYAVLLVVAGGQFEPLNDLLQMAPFPSSEFQASLIGILVFNFAAAYGIEKLCQRLE